MPQEASLRVVVTLRPEAAVPPPAVDLPQRLEFLKPPEDPDARIGPYFISIDEWAVPNPAGPPSPLIGSERGARHFVIHASRSLDAGTILGRLRSNQLVEQAYVEPLYEEPPTGVQPQDDEYSAEQRYLDEAPVGIDARFAWAFANGTDASITDIEQGWFFKHPDLPRIKKLKKFGLNFDCKEHGTSVLGMIVGMDNSQGIIGIAPGARGRAISEWRLRDVRRVGDAILTAVSQMHPGEILLIESQARAPVGPPEFVPVEVRLPAYNATEMATSRGITVIEAAGNGNVDLDAYRDGGVAVFDRTVRDSGAILVGAAKADRSREPSSCHGRRVDCFAWGENIRTADGRNSYRPDFGRTSGASAIVAGAAALLQSWRIARGADLYSPRRLRELLSSTFNTPSASAKDRIGVMPDLRAIIEREGP